MRKSHPAGVSIIHIFFRDGMIYFAVIFGAARLLVYELELSILTRVGSHGRMVFNHLPMCYDQLGGLGFLVCPVSFISVIQY